MKIEIRSSIKGNTHITIPKGISAVHFTTDDGKVVFEVSIDSHRSIRVRAINSHYFHEDCAFYSEQILVEPLASNTITISTKEL